MKVRISLLSGGGFYFLLLMFISANVLAQEAKVYTLDEAVKEALANNWRLKAKEERFQQASYVKNQARAEFLPKLSTSYGYSRYGSLRTTDIEGRKFDVGSLNNYEWRGTVTQPIFTGFALISAYRLAQPGIDDSTLTTCSRQTSKSDIQRARTTPKWLSGGIIYKEGDTPSVSGGSGLEASNWEASVGLTWRGLWENINA